MSKGKIIYVTRRLSLEEKKCIRQGNVINIFEYRHYGIDLGDGTVIHLTSDSILDAESARIQRTKMEQFSKGSQVNEDKMAAYAYEPDEIVLRARKLIGSNFGGYNFFKNNCEHFANWCASGKKISRQIFFLEDGQDIVEKAIDRMFEPLMEHADQLDESLTLEEKEKFDDLSKLLDGAVEVFESVLDSSLELIDRIIDRQCYDKSII